MWFVWNGIDSRAMGLYVTELPPVKRPAERVQTVTIPGRSGHLTLLEGDQVHDGYTLECQITAPMSLDLAPVLAWLSGEGTVIFANEPQRSHEARIAAEISFDRVGYSAKQATVTFFCQPYKAEFPEQGEITITGTSGTLTNPGDIPARPLVNLVYTGTITVNFDGKPMVFANSPGNLLIDCEAQQIINNVAGTIWTGTYYGDFWQIPKGQVSVTASASCTLRIKPRWRWL